MRKKSRHRGHPGLRLLMVAAPGLAFFPAVWADGTSDATKPKPAAETKATVATATQEAATEAKPRLDIYGAAMLDMGYETGQSHPDWFDVARPTKLPAYKDEFGKDGRFFAGVRQSRLGFKGFIPTSLGELRTTFEFELFGTGTDAGQTTFRLRHAYGKLGHLGPDKRGLHSWTRTSSPTRSSTGARTAWSFSAMCRSVGCRSWAIRP